MAVGANQQEVIRFKVRCTDVDLDLNFQSDRPREDMRNACSSCLLFSVQALIDEILNQTVILAEFGQLVLPLLHARYECGCRSETRENRGCHSFELGVV